MVHLYNVADVVDDDNVSGRTKVLIADVNEFENVHK